MEIASRFERSVAWLIDVVLIIFTMYSLMHIVFLISFGPDVEIQSQFESNISSKWYHELSMVIVLWIIFTIYQFTVKKILGGTLGQLYVGIREINHDKNKKKRMFLRDLCAFWLWITFPIFWSNKDTGQTFYDKWFNIKVIRFL